MMRNFAGDKLCARRSRCPMAKLAIRVCRLTQRLTARRQRLIGLERLFHHDLLVLLRRKRLDLFMGPCSRGLGDQKPMAISTCLFGLCADRGYPQVVGRDRLFRRDVAMFSVSQYFRKYGSSTASLDSREGLYGKIQKQANESQLVNFLRLHPLGMEAT